AGDDRAAQPVDPPAGVGELRCQAGASLIQLRACFLEPLNLGAQRAGPLDERCMRGAGLGRASTQVLPAFAGLEQTPLGLSELLVRDPLLLFELHDRRARFILTTLEAVALVFGLAALARQLLTLLHEPRGFLSSSLELSLAADDDLVELVL